MPTARLGEPDRPAQPKETAMDRTTSLGDRVAAASGGAYVLLTVVGNSMGSMPEGDHPDGPTDLAWLHGPHGTGETLGFALEVLGMLALLTFLPWFASTMRRRGGPGEAAHWLAGVAVVAGGVALAVKFASFLPMGAAFLDRDELDVRTALVLMDMDAAGFVVSFIPFAVMVIAAAAAGLTSGVLGRLAGWSGVAVGVLTLVLTLATGVDPTRTNPMPFLAGLLWLLAVSARLVWRGPRPVAGVAATTPQAVVA
jgi:hypothetical protein